MKGNDRLLPGLRAFSTSSCVFVLEDCEFDFTTVPLDQVPHSPVSTNIEEFEVGETSKQMGVAIGGEG